MKKILSFVGGALLTTLVTTFVFFNYFSGIIGGIWLAILGNWSSIIYGLLIGALMPFGYAIVNLPSIPLSLLLLRFIERNKLFLASIIGFISVLYSYVIIIFWVFFVFKYFTAEATSASLIPFLLWGYAMTMGPLGYMASKDSSNSAGFGSAMGMFLAILSYIILTIMWFTVGINFFALIVLAIIFTILNLILSIPALKLMHLDKNVDIPSVHSKTEYRPSHPTIKSKTEKLEEKSQSTPEWIEINEDRPANVIYFPDTIQHKKKPQSSHTGMQIYESPAAGLLKKEIKRLQNVYNKLILIKNEIEKLIFEFDNQLTMATSDLILKILKIKSERLSEDINNSYVRDEEYKRKVKDYEDTMNDYKNYESRFDESKKQIVLNEDQKRELKEKYRKASKLCHPDVTNLNESVANKIFNELCRAYKENNLGKVSEILNKLENNSELSDQRDIQLNNTEKDKLEEILEGIKNNIKNLRNEINGLKKSKTYKLAYNNKDWGAYFTKIKAELHEQLDNLENDK